MIALERVQRFEAASILRCNQAMRGHAGPGAIRWKLSVNQCAGRRGQRRGAYVIPDLDAYCVWKLGLILPAIPP